MKIPFGLRTRDTWTKRASKRARGGRRSTPSGTPGRRDPRQRPALPPAFADRRTSMHMFATFSACPSPHITTSTSACVDKIERASRERARARRSREQSSAAHLGDHGVERLVRELERARVHVLEGDEPLVGVALVALALLLDDDGGDVDVVNRPVPVLRHVLGQARVAAAGDEHRVVALHEPGDASVEASRADRGRRRARARARARLWTRRCPSTAGTNRRARGPRCSDGPSSPSCRTWAAWPAGHRRSPWDKAATESTRARDRHGQRANTRGAES